MQFMTLIRYAKTSTIKHLWIEAIDIIICFNQDALKNSLILSADSIAWRPTKMLQGAKFMLFFEVKILD